MAVVLTAALLMPVTAHTVEQLQDWESDWQSRAVGSFDVKLLEEWRDMRARHPWFYTPDEPAISTATRVYTSRPPRPPSPGVEAWRTLVATYFPAENVDRALSVLSCESRGDPYADNPRSTARGLFQFLSSTWNTVAGYTGSPTYDLAAYDPTWQVINTVWLSKGGSDWSHWVCKP